MTGTSVARLVGGATLGSGVGLMVAPGLSLRLLGADTPPPAPLLFRVVGMFMTVSGGLLLDDPGSPVVLRWSVVQKCGAVAGVTLGVVSGDYHRRGMAVAGFDAVSAVLLARMLVRARGGGGAR